MSRSCTLKPTSGAKKISEHLLPRTRAYAEIWLDQEKVATTDEEPILGQTYLPRKFKTTVVIRRRTISICTLTT
ncbi:sulfite reductase subunit beta [Salmonella bongori]|nr:sulfite reductase subunit beta [Salmonella bongori]